MFWKSLIPAIINPISLFFLWRTDVLFILTKFCWLLHIFGSLCSVDYYSIIVQLFQWILLIIFNI